MTQRLTDRHHSELMDCVRLLCTKYQDEIIMTIQSTGQAFMDGIRETIKKLRYPDTELFHLLNKTLNLNPPIYTPHAIVVKTKRRIEVESCLHTRVVLSNSIMEGLIMYLSK